MELSVLKIDGTESGKKVVLNDETMSSSILPTSARELQRPKTAARLHTAPRSLSVRKDPAVPVTAAARLVSIPAAEGFSARSLVTIASSSTRSSNSLQDSLPCHTR